MVRKALLAMLAASLALPLGATSPAAADPAAEPYAIAQTATEGVHSLGKEANGTFGVGQNFLISAASRLHSISVYISTPRFVSNMELLGLRPGDETDRIVCELMDPSPLAQGAAPRVLARSEIAGFGAVPATAQGRAGREPLDADWKTFTFPEQPLLQPGTYLFGVSVTTGGLFGYHLAFGGDPYPQGRAYMKVTARPTGEDFGWSQSLAGDSAFGIGLTGGAEQLRETTPPIVTPVLSSPPNQYGWHNSSVALSWSATDPESGIVLTSPECAGRTLVDETPDLLITCYAINGAGTRTPTSMRVAIDKTPPSITASVDPPPEPDGWRYAETTVTFSATDELSGIATVTPPIVLTEGEGLAVIGTATDFAGNSASVTVEGINVWLGEPAVEPQE